MLHPGRTYFHTSQKKPAKLLFCNWFYWDTSLLQLVLRLLAMIIWYFSFFLFLLSNPWKFHQAIPLHTLQYISSYLLKVLQVYLGNNTCPLKTSHDFLLPFTQSSTWGNWVGWALQWQTCKMATSSLTEAHNSSMAISFLIYQLIRRLFHMWFLLIWGLPVHYPHENTSPTHARHLCHAALTHSATAHSCLSNTLWRQDTQSLW